MKKYTLLSLLVMIIIFSCSLGNEDTADNDVTKDVYDPSAIKGVQRELTGEWDGRIYDFTIPSQYADIQSRKITVVLPPEYTNEMKYDTIYMHDGQNLFDSDSYGHGGWQADTTINTLSKDKSINPQILVCIPSAGSKREYEFTDEKAGAPHYMGYIVDRIIPVIEHNYSVKKTRDGRTIGGSSYGGIISLYAGWQYSSVFSKVIAMSPSLHKTWVVNKTLTEAKPDIKLYIDTGDMEDPDNSTNNYILGLQQVGFTANTNLKYVYGIGHNHNEEAWRARLPDALKFLVPMVTYSEEIDQYLDTIQFNGAVLVKNEEGVLVKKGYGMANFSLDLSNDIDTGFIIASLTKQFTATAILQLVDDGKLKLTDSITTYINYPNAQAVTVHHLLSHSSGIPDYVGLDLVDYTKEYTPEELVASLKNAPLTFTPGGRYEYSNSNYMILGVIIEKVSGVTYSAYLQKHIFDPLDMKNSCYSHDYYSLSTSAKGYTSIINKTEAADNIMSIPYAAGGISSTVEDLEKWDLALYTDAILSEDSKKLMYTRQSGSYGYGWDINSDGTIVSHSGLIEGFRNFISRNIAKHQVVVVLGNCTTQDAEVIAQKLYSIMNTKK